MHIKEVNKNLPAYQSLYDLFPKVGDVCTVEEVLEITGLKKEAIYVYLSNFRNKLPDRHKIDVRVNGKFLVREN